MPDTIAGFLHSNRLVNGRPDALRTWRITTGQFAVATAASDLLGGEVRKLPNGDFEIITKASTIHVFIIGEYVSIEMKKWHQSKLVHHCDGYTLLQAGSSYGKPCGCPNSITEIREKAKNGTGPQPNVIIYLKFSTADALGFFRLNSTSWKILELAREIKKGGAEYELTLTKRKINTDGGRTLLYFEPELRGNHSVN
ncbi:hypothetical protein [Streptomyces sp. NRRL F-5135]|uniref:recombination directionality factor n=1 Tax=Streptomyces sp. NRRL F-5135 TaxID=1463858 RepID=UPI00131DDB68|nr:hypothetical protein [Streptomyces sp. NRRL F-5135]